MKFRLEKFPNDPSPAHPEGNWRHSPVITVGLATRKDSERIYLLALIDSGADACVFHADFGRQIGLKIEEGPSAEYFGVGGQKIVSYSD